MINPDIQRILSSDRIEAMEAAKRISGDIASSTDLAAIATDKTNSEWSRVAATYALGSINDHVSGAALVSILRDRSENEECRAHAAEALAHVRHPEAVYLMESILASDDEPPEVKLWCVYSLSEIGGAGSLKAIKQLAQTKPNGKLGKELRLVLRRNRKQSN
jgi:HEAT repeat protein